MRVRRLVLVRHVTSTWSEQGILQGHQDPPLSERGKAMLPGVLTLVRRLTDGATVHVASSDLRRALDTALHLSPGLDSGDVIISKALCEVSFGDWEGRLESELSHVPTLEAAYRTLDPRLVWPGTDESLGHKLTKAVRFVDEWSCGVTGIAVVVSHGIVLQGILSRIFFGHFERAAQFEIPQGGVSAVDVDASFDLRVVHVLGAEPSLLSS